MKRWFIAVAVVPFAIACPGGGGGADAGFGASPDLEEASYSYYGVTDEGFGPECQMPDFVGERAAGELITSDAEVDWWDSLRTDGTDLYWIATRGFSDDSVENTDSITRYDVASSTTTELATVGEVVLDLEVSETAVYFVDARGSLYSVDKRVASTPTLLAEGDFSQLELHGQHIYLLTEGTINSCETIGGVHVFDVASGELRAIASNLPCPLSFAINDDFIFVATRGSRDPGSRDPAVSRLDRTTGQVLASASVSLQLTDLVPVGSDVYFFVDHEIMDFTSVDNTLVRMDADGAVEPLSGPCVFQVGMQLTSQGLLVAEGSFYSLIKDDLSRSLAFGQGAYGSFAVVGSHVYEIPSVTAELKRLRIPSF